MRFKVLSAVVAALALMSAAVGVSSATSRPSKVTTAKTEVTTQARTTNLEPAASLVGDDAGTCVLLRSGRVECWGDNTYGALGNGTVTSVWYTDIPVAAKDLTGTRRA